MEIKTNNKSLLSSNFFAIAIILIYLNFVRGSIDQNGNIFGYYIRVLSIVSGPLFLLLSTFIAITEGQFRRIKNRYRAWIILLLLYFIFIIINGLLINRNEIRLITLDMLMFAMVFPGILIGAKQVNWIKIDKIFINIFFINVLVLLPYIWSYGSLMQEMRRTIITGYGQIPYFFWGGLTIWPYILLTIKNRSLFYKIVSILGIVLYFYFALVFLKRSPFGYAILFLLLYLISNKLNIKTVMRNFSLSFVAIIISFLIFRQINVSSTVERLQDRFLEKGSLTNTLLQSDRITNDYGMVLSQFSGLEYMIGRGLGGVVRDVNNSYAEEMTSTLHNGPALMMLKGGFIWMIIWYSGWFMLIKDFIYNKNKHLNKYFLPILIPLLLTWVFGFLRITMDFILITMCAGRLMAKEENSKIKKIGYINRG